MSGIAVLIVAAGRGHRLGGSIPKQYLSFGQKPLITHVVDCFRNHPKIDLVRVVIHPDDKYLYKKTLDYPVILPPVWGGDTRQESVRLGLNSLVPLKPTLVLIHDAARPNIDSNLISRLIISLEKNKAVIPAVPIVDALKKSSKGFVSRTFDRTKFWRAQTPQAFHFKEILQAHISFKGENAADDSQVAELAGLKVKIIKGDEKNKKITYLEDLMEGFMASEIFESRVGFGFDVHQFKDGNSLVLCGINIPFEMGLKGHSDADVGLHAITDALLGTIGCGDIGEHFPPSDKKWKNSPSKKFLTHVHKMVTDREGTIVNIDLTFICEAPKISPHKKQMKKYVAEVLRLSEQRINIKGTTTEKLGFLGRREGICANAVATVSFPVR